MQGPLNPGNVIRLQRSYEYACAALQVCHSKVEELQLPDDERVDVLVSEPMGTLLVNERMLETYLYARDHFLKPGGKMFPVCAVGMCCRARVSAGSGARDSGRPQGHSQHVRLLLQTVTSDM